MAHFYDYTYNQLIEYQIERTRRWQPNITIPEPPKEFDAWTKTEVPLLSCLSTAPALWRALVLPVGYAKHMSESIRFDLLHMRTVPRKPRQTQTAAWSAYDPEHGRGARPVQFTRYANIAGIETLAAVNLLPGMIETWQEGGSMPIMSACRISGNGSWSYVPRLHADSETGVLELQVIRDDECDERWASPTFRVLG